MSAGGISRISAGLPICRKPFAEAANRRHNGPLETTEIRKTVAMKSHDDSGEQGRRQREWDDADAALRRFLADPVAKRALKRLKKRDREIAPLLERIEASVEDDFDSMPAPSEEDEALLDQVFGEPSEDERRKADVALEEWIADFREVEREFNAEQGYLLYSTTPKGLWFGQ
jgi:hypothetical protein